MGCRLSCLLLLSVVAFGCGHNRRSATTVLTRASFDFQCPKEQIELIVIDEEGARNLASQIAAHGCAKKAVYVFVPDTYTWVLNGAVTPADVVHDPNAYHGKKMSRKEKRADKKARNEAQELEKPPVD
ncbi:MAG: hypothetical protein WBG86_08610 [Polyangiales bacterium]